MKTSRLAGLALVSVAALTLAACASDAEPTETAGSTEPTADAAAEFPITIEHVYGSTTIEAKPERVADVLQQLVAKPVDYAEVETGTAARAATMIAELL